MQLPQSIYSFWPASIRGVEWARRTVTRSCVALKHTFENFENGSSVFRDTSRCGTGKLVTVARLRARRISCQPLPSESLCSQLPFERASRIWQPSLMPKMWNLLKGPTLGTGSKMLQKTWVLKVWDSSVPHEPPKGLRVFAIVLVGTAAEMPGWSSIGWILRISEGGLGNMWELKTR